MSIDKRVQRHFRDVRRVLDLSAAEPFIYAFTDAFEPRARHAYTHAALEMLRTLPHRPTAVFLDPDTGLAEEPRSQSHVTAGDLAAFWSALNPGEWLVLYQHAAREPHWRTTRRAAFAQALGFPEVVTFYSRNGARDVAFFAAGKPTRA